MNLQKEIADYLKHCEYQKKLSGLSLKAYSIDLGQFIGSINCTSVQMLTKTAICDYIQGLHQNYRPKTVKRKLASLRAFLNHLEFEEILEVNPIRKIKTKFQEPRELPKTIPLRIIEQLLNAAHEEKETATTQYGSFAALRDKALLETLFATGMRVSELCSLKTSDINLDEGIINIMGKGTKERIVQIGNKEVLNSLKQYRDANKSGSTFFLSIGWQPEYPNSRYGS